MHVWKFCVVGLWSLMTKGQDYSIDGHGKHDASVPLKHRQKTWELRPWAQLSFSVKGPPTIWTQTPHQAPYHSHAIAHAILEITDKSLRPCYTLTFLSLHQNGMA